MSRIKDIPKPIRLTVKKPTDEEAFMAWMWSGPNSGPNALLPAPTIVSLIPRYTRRIKDLTSVWKDDAIRFADVCDAVAAAMYGIAEVIAEVTPVRPTRWDLVI